MLLIKSCAGSWKRLKTVLILKIVAKSESVTWRIRVLHTVSFTKFKAGGGGLYLRHPATALTLSSNFSWVTPSSSCSRSQSTWSRHNGDLSSQICARFPANYSSPCDVTGTMTLHPRRRVSCPREATLWAVVFPPKRYVTHCLWVWRPRSRGRDDVKHTKVLQCVNSRRGHSSVPCDHPALSWVIRQ